MNKLNKIKIGDTIIITLFKNKIGIVLEIDGDSFLIEDDLGTNQWWNIEFIK